MAELITPEQPRIKFGLRRVGTHEVAEARASRELRALCELMLQMEAAGAAPVLNDGKVGGNCALDEDLALDTGPQASRPVGPEVAAATGCRASASGTGDSHAAAILVSRSGKAPGAALAAEDFARVCAFDRAAWAADYQSPSEALRPSADTPLLWACLAPGAREAYGWTARPRVAFHGHALESGAGLLAARRRGIPVSERETLFSTREDLGELEALFRAHPYPQHRAYIRRGHGFFVLGKNVAECAATFQSILSAADEALACGAGGGGGVRGLLTGGEDASPPGTSSPVGATS